MMKNILKYGLLLFSLLVISACSTTELDLLDNPNEVTPDNAELDLVFNNVMYNFGRFLDEASDETMPYVRMTAMDDGNQYQNQDGPTSFDFIWGLAYSDMLPDIKLVRSLAEADGLTTYSGIAKVIEAYIATTLVDLFGDVPYSQAGLGAENQNPNVDAGADVYAAALALLDSAIADLGSPIGTPANDLFYGGNAANWMKAANSLKIRIHVQTKLVGGSGSEIANIVSGGNYIQTSSEDLQFNYGNSRENPDSRHPYYSDGYESGGPGWYHSNFNMWLMFGDKNTEDPRLRYYYYRQDCDETDEDQFTLDCPSAPYPLHWPAGLPFCTASGEWGDPNDEYGGYWGRDHGNDDGIPPDDLKRTAWGLYPAGGKFDADDCSQVSNSGTDGQGGQGIFPVLTSSFVEFLLAEAALTMGSGGDARAHLEAGVRESIGKVMAFAGGSSNAAFTPSADDVNNYVNEVLQRFDNASNKLDVVMLEYHLALFGNGLDAYNNYRRTGLPSGMQPTREADSGRYARSFWYPSDFVNLNSSVSQKDIENQVFWDTNPPGFIN